MQEETIFSKIISGDIPCIKIYEDEIVLAFLDINPSNHGHTLVIPKIFSVDATETDPMVMSHIMTIGQRIARAQRSTLNAAGNNLIFNCGAAGGQEVFHTHLHVIPRYKDDGIFQPVKHTTYVDDEAETVAARLRNKL